MHSSILLKCLGPVFQTVCSRRLSHPRRKRFNMCMDVLDMGDIKIEKQGREVRNLYLLETGKRLES